MSNQHPSHRCVWGPWQSDGAVYTSGGKRYQPMRRGCTVRGCSDYELKNEPL